MLFLQNLHRLKTTRNSSNLSSKKRVLIGFHNYARINSSVEIINNSGQVVYQQLKLNADALTLNLADLPTADYFARLTMLDGQVMTKKFVIVK
jgi:hypothetical protein